MHKTVLVAIDLGIEGGTLVDLTDQVLEPYFFNNVAPDRDVTVLVGRYYQNGEVIRVYDEDNIDVTNRIGRFVTDEDLPDGFRRIYERAHLVFDSLESYALFCGYDVCRGRIYTNNYKYDHYCISPEFYGRATGGLNYCNYYSYDNMSVVNNILNEAELEVKHDYYNIYVNFYKWLAGKFTIKCNGEKVIPLGILQSFDDGFELHVRKCNTNVTFPVSISRDYVTKYEPFLRFLTKIGMDWATLKDLPYVRFSAVQLKSDCDENQLKEDKFSHLQDNILINPLSYSDFKDKMIEFYTPHVDVLVGSDYTEQQGKDLTYMKCRRFLKKAYSETALASIFLCVVDSYL